MTATTNGVLMPPADPVQHVLDVLEADTTTPHASIEELIARADRNGNKRAKLVAVRIRHDADLLQKLLTEHGEEAAARRKVEKLRAQLQAAEAELRAKTAPARNIAQLAGTSHPAPSATTKEIRAWLLAHGHDVADRGRLTGAQIDLYENAHRGDGAA
jgi:hypothetical protein